MPDPYGNPPRSPYQNPSPFPPPYGAPHPPAVPATSDHAQPAPEDRLAFGVTGDRQISVDWQIQETRVHGAMAPELAATLYVQLGSCLELLGWRSIVDPEPPTSATANSSHDPAVIDAYEQRIRDLERRLNEQKNSPAFDTTSPDERDSSLPKRPYQKGENLPIPWFKDGDLVTVHWLETETGVVKGEPTAYPKDSPTPRGQRVPVHLDSSPDPDSISHLDSRILSRRTSDDH